MSRQQSPIVAYRKKNVYTVNFDDVAKQMLKCFASIEESSWLQNHPLGHASMELIRKLSHNEHVHGLPKLKFEKNQLCDACQIGNKLRIL